MTRFAGGEITGTMTVEWINPDFARILATDPVTYLVDVLLAGSAEFASGAYSHDEALIDIVSSVSALADDVHLRRLIDSVHLRRLIDSVRAFHRARWVEINDIATMKRSQIGVVR